MRHLRNQIPAGWPPALLQASLPSNGMATSASNAATTDPNSHSAIQHGLPMPLLRQPLPRRSVLCRVPSLLPSGRRRWTLPSVRRTGGHRRSATRWSSSCLTPSEPLSSARTRRLPPDCLRYPTAKEVTTRQHTHAWAALLTATGHITWPSAGAFHGRHWARPRLCPTFRAGPS